MAYVKNPTKAQKEQWAKNAEEKENKAKEMIKNVAKNYMDNPEELADMFAFGSKFYQYSPKNTMLIMAQNRGATYVQSYDAWKKMGHPVVRKGAISIFVPVKTTLLEVAENKFVPKSKASKEQLEDYKNGKIRGIEKQHFKLGNVFDISATDFPKEEYPKLFFMGYSSDMHNDICKGIEDFSMNKLGVPILTEDLQSIAIRGMYIPSERVIKLNEKLEDTQKLSTMAHELGHAMIHSMPSEKTTSQKEFEADALSIMIETNYGLELTDARKSHLKDHFNNFKSEISSESLKNTGKELTEAQIESKVDEVFSTVYSFYKDNIADIEASVEKYLPKERLLEYEASKGIESGLEVQNKSAEKVTAPKEKKSYMKEACAKASKEHGRKSNSKSKGIEL